MCGHSHLQLPPWESCRGDSSSWLQRSGRQVGGTTRKETAMHASYASLFALERQKKNKHSIFAPWIYGEQTTSCSYGIKWHCMECKYPRDDLWFSQSMRGELKSSAPCRNHHHQRQSKPYSDFGRIYPKRTPRWWCEQAESGHGRLCGPVHLIKTNAWAGYFVFKIQLRIEAHGYALGN